MATVVTPMTTEEMLAIPEDGVRRWLIDGELRESSMTVRNRFHSRIMISVGTELEIWLRQQPAPRGQILGGEAGVRLSHDPDVTVGIDVGYVSREVLDRQTNATTLIDGVPTLIVEILSPSDTVENIDEKLAAYRRAKVPVVWLIDVTDQSVTAYRPKGRLRLYNIDEDLSGEPELPGFSVPVARAIRVMVSGVDSGRLLLLRRTTPELLEIPDVGTRRWLIDRGVETFAQTSSLSVHGRILISV